jgi:hypothetical protein
VGSLGGGFGVRLVVRNRRLGCLSLPRRRRRDGNGWQEAGVKGFEKRVSHNVTGKIERFEWRFGGGVGNFEEGGKGKRPNDSLFGGD